MVFIFVLCLSYGDQEENPQPSESSDDVKECKVFAPIPFVAFLRGGSKISPFAGTYKTGSLPTYPQMHPHGYICG